MYGKIFDSMYEGTLYGHWEAIVTLQQMLVLCNSDGIIDMTPQAIAARTSIPLEIITKGIAVLAEPDPYSRTPGEEGRRIVLMDEHRPWGWVIVNYAKYRDMKNRREKMEADRLRISEKRKAQKNNDVALCSKESQPVANVAHASVSVSASKATEATTTTKVKTLSSAASRSLAPKGSSNGKEAKSGLAWKAYSAAYCTRHGAEPVRNAKVNSALAALVERLGADEAPQVAAFYVSHNNPFYVRDMHSTNLLLRDAEKLRTEWATGRKMTSLEAKGAEQGDAMREQIKRVEKLLENEP